MKYFITGIVIFFLNSPAHSIDTYKAKTIEVYKAKTVEAYKSQNQLKEQASAPAKEDVSALFGAWQTVVPGGVWTSPSAIPGWETLHVGTGALAGLLVIYADGTYVWNAYGGKKGRWITPGRSGYPIALEDKVERRMWNVGLDKRHPGKIWIWDGKAFNYQGTRAK